MKKVLLSSVALAVMTASAMAADLPSRRMAPAPAYVAVPVFTWTGFYVGVNAGYGFTDNNNNNGFGNSGNLFANGTGFGTGVTPVIATPGTFFTNSDGNRNRDGFTGGGQIGYNYQFGNIVVGVEGDIQYTDFGRRRGTGTFSTAIPDGVNIGGGSPNVAFNRQGNQSDYYGTVRGRLGYAMDRTLVYATGGVAFRDTGGNNNNNNFFGFNSGFQRQSDDTGYVVGGGVEYAFTPNITGRIEGMYVNFGHNGNNNNNGNLGGFSAQNVGVTNTGRPVVAINSTRGRDDDFAVVRAGINYKFNGW